MPRYILKITGKKKTSYMIWSTIVDAPIIYDMTRQDVIDWHKKSFGTEGDYSLDRKLEEVEKTGSSIGEDPRKVVNFNRAGKGEKCLSYDEIVAIFVDLSKPEK